MGAAGIVGSFTLERKILRSLGVLQLVLLVLSLAIIAFGQGRAWGYVFLVGMLALFSVAGTGLYFYSRYRSLPLVKEKHKVLGERTGILREINYSQSAVQRAAAERARIGRSESGEIERRRQFHETLAAGFLTRRSQISQDQARQLAEELEFHQKQHVWEGLERASLWEAKIPGIGPKMKARMGISNASQVSAVRLQGVKGLGPAKIAQLLSWRDSIESSLQATAPRKLPANAELSIREKYRGYLDEIVSAEANEDADLKADLAAITERTSSERARIDAAESDHRRKLDALGSARQDVEQRLASYENVTFRGFLGGIVREEEKGGSRWRRAVRMGAPSAVVVGVLLQMPASLVGAGGMIVSSLPTSTATPTETPTITPTWTSTNTLTPTITPTASITPTPTITWTPTMTSTPTETFTPTMTGTSTLTPRPTPRLPSVPAGECVPMNTLRQSGKVIDVVDGDTIQVLIEGTYYPVRYIGIDAPEMDQELGTKSRLKNVQLLGGQTVILVKDVSETDRYDRLLRYVIAGTVFVNHEMVRSGYAYASTYPPDVACSESFAEAEASAVENNRGFWAPTPAPGGAGPGGGNCDPSYPTVCIPPPPPDLDCGDIGYRRFQVVGSDPHGFDGDGDGIGCESG